MQQYRYFLKNLVHRINYEAYGYSVIGSNDNYITFRHRQLQ